MLDRGPRIAVAAVVAIWLALSLAASIGTAAWEANDEPDHVRNVQTLVGGDWYRIRPGAGFEAHQPPAYYLLLAAWQKALGVPPRETIAPPLRPQEDCCTRGTIRHDHPLDGNDQRLVGALRLPGIALGALTILLTAAAARRLSEDPWTPPVAAACIAAVPKFVFLSAVVNNDNLAITVGAAGLLLALITLRRRDSATEGHLWFATGLGAVAGVAVITKLTAAWIIPALVAVAFLAARPYLRARLVGLLSFGVGAAITCGWWLVQNQVRYGDPLAADATRDHLEDLFPPLFAVGSFTEQAFSVAPRVLYETFWYVSGYNQFDWKWHVYLPFWLGLFAALCGLLRRRRPLSAPKGSLFVLWTMVAGALVALWATAIETTTAQARTVFFALPAVACLAALGFERWRLPVPVRFVLPALAAGTTVIALRRDVFNIFVFG